MMLCFLLCRLILSSRKRYFIFLIVKFLILYVTKQFVIYSESKNYYYDGKMKYNKNLAVY